MSNIITAGNATNNGTSISSDTSGVLELRTGSTPTTALTIGTSGQVGVGSTPSYGTSGQVLTSQGSGAAPVWATASGITSGTAQASTSGTSIDFTGLPAGLKRITVMFNGVSTSGTSFIQFQIGSGSIDTTNYFGAQTQQASGASGGASGTSGFGIQSALAANLIYGHGVFNLLGSNTWTFSFNGATTTGQAVTLLSAGAKTLSGTLDRVRITTVNGTDTFDAGTINILYE